MSYLLRNIPLYLSQLKHHSDMQEHTLRNIYIYIHSYIYTPNNTSDQRTPEWVSGVEVVRQVYFSLHWCVWLLNTVCCPYAIQHGLLPGGMAGMDFTSMLRLNDVNEFFVWKFDPVSGCFNRSCGVSEERFGHVYSCLLRPWKLGFLHQVFYLQWRNDGLWKQKCL